MGLLQDIVMKLFMLFVQMLAHFGQPYLFRILLSPQFFPSPEQLEELIGLHPGATVLNIGRTLDPRNLAGDIEHVSDGLIKVPAGLDPKAIEGQLDKLSGGPSKGPTLPNEPFIPLGGPAAITGGLIGALGMPIAPATGSGSPGFTTNHVPEDSGASLTAIPASTSEGPEAAEETLKSFEGIPGAKISGDVAAKLERLMGGSNSAPIQGPTTPTTTLAPSPLPATATLLPPKSVTGFSSADPGLDEFVGNSVPAFPAVTKAAIPAPQAPTSAENSTATSPKVNPMNLAGALGKVAEGGLKSVSVVGGGGLPWTLIGKKA